MTAECTRTKLMFQGLDGREVVGRFDGGEITPTPVASSCVKWSTGPRFWVVLANVSPTTATRIGSNTPSRP